MPTDYSKTGAEMVLDLINEENGTEFRPEDLTLGTPQPLGPPNLRNTALIVTSTGTTTMVGSRTVTYDRLTLTDFFNNGDLTFPDNPAYLTVADVLPAINDRFNINLNLTHVYDDPIQRGAPGDPVVITLRARPSSLVFLGTVDITLDEETAPSFTVTYDQSLVGAQYFDEYGNLLINVNDGLNGAFAVGQSPDYRLIIRPYIVDVGPAIDDPTTSGLGDGAFEIGPEDINDARGTWALDVIFESLTGAEFTQVVEGRVIVFLNDGVGAVNTVTLRLVKNGSNYELVDTDTYLASQAQDYANPEGTVLMFRLPSRMFLPYMPTSVRNPDDALMGPMAAQVHTLSLADGTFLEAVDISYSVLGGESWPTWEPNTSVGEVHAPGGLMPLGTDAGDPNDGFFLKSRSAPLPAGGEMVTAIRLYASNTPAAASLNMGEYDELYVAVDRQNPEVDHIFEAVIGTGPIADGQTLLDRATIRIQFAVVDATYPGTQTFASMNGVITGDPEFPELGFAPNPDFPPIQGWLPEFPANWTAPDMSSLQMRGSMKFMISNIPSNMWNGEGDVKVMVSIQVLDKNNPNILLGEAWATLNSVLFP